MDWANERWVKVYTRDTVTMRLMSWQARCLFWELLRKVDMSGWLELDGHGADGLAVALGCDRPDAERALAEWVKAGWVDDADPGGLLVPTHREAQATPQSNALRQRTKRTRHAATREDTPRHAKTREDTKSVAPDTKRVAPDTKSVAPDTSRHVATRIDKIDKIDKSECTRAPDGRDPNEQLIVDELAKHSALSRLDHVAVAEQVVGFMAANGRPLSWHLDAIARAGAAAVGAEVAGEPWDRAGVGRYLMTVCRNPDRPRAEGRGDYERAAQADQDQERRARKREAEYRRKLEAASAATVDPPSMAELMKAIGK